MRQLSSTDLTLLESLDPKGHDSLPSIEFHSFLMVPPKYGVVLSDGADVFYLGFSNASPVAYLVRHVGNGELNLVFPFLRSLGVSELYYKKTNYHDINDVVLKVPPNVKPRFSDVWDFIFHHSLSSQEETIMRVSCS